MWWTEHVVPRLTDASLKGHEVGDLRGMVLRGLSGRVVEIGFGSGLNVRWYPEEVSVVHAVEPSDLGWRLSERRRSGSQVPVERVALDGQRIDLPDRSYDAAVSTFTLCTVPDPAAALGELRRLVRPGAALRVLEHGLSPDPDVARRQARWEPLQRRVAGGCHLTRDPLDLVTSAGFRIDQHDAAYLDGPRISRPWTYVHSIWATA